MFPSPIFAWFPVLLLAFSIGACARPALREDAREGSRTASLIVAELAVSESRWPEGAREYARLAAGSDDVALLTRATAVTGDAAQPTLALRTAEHWLRVSPGARDAHLAAGIAALQLNRIDDSASHLRAFMGHSVDKASFEQLEEPIAEAGNAFGARQVVDRLTKDYGGSAAAMKLRAAMQSGSEDDAAAVDSLRAALALDPQAEDLRWPLVQSLAAAGRPEEALMQADRNLAHRGEWTDQLQHAILLIALHREPAAQAELEAVAENSEGRPAALRLMGQLQLQLGHEEQASACFTQLLTDGKFIDDSFYFLGLIHERRGRAESAMRSYARVSAGEHYVPAMLRIGALLNKSGAGPQSEAIFTQLVRVSPARAPAIIAAHAQILSDAANNAGALTLLDAAVRDYPDSVELRYERAQVLEQNLRVDEAVAELEGVLKRRPRDPAAMNALGYTLADHSRSLARARRLIESALASAPQSPAILDSKGWVLFRQGKAEQAVPALSAAFRAQYSADVGAHLGEVLWTLGRKDEAVRIWDRARIDDPVNALLLATRTRLERR